MIALLASVAGSGCLITDPVQPVDDSGNTNPKFIQVNPENEFTVFLANTTTPVTFTARANDNETTDDELYYEWTVDNGPVIFEGPREFQYSTTGAALGAGVHVISVLVTDDGLPTGFAVLEWQVQVQ